MLWCSWRCLQAGQGLDITSLWMLSGGRNERVISWLEARQSSSSSSQSPAGRGLQGWRRTADVEGNIPLWVSFPRDSMVRTDIKAQFKETGARAHTRVSVRVAFSWNKYNEEKTCQCVFLNEYTVFGLFFFIKGGKESLWFCDWRARHRCAPGESSTCFF